MAGSKDYGGSLGVVEEALEMPDHRRWRCGGDGGRGQGAGEHGRECAGMQTITKVRAILIE